MHLYNIHLPATSVSREKDMTAWSLWQKMPPRYQLTTRSPQDSEEQEVYIDDRPRTPRTPRPMTSPRSQGDTNARPSPRAYLAGSPRQGETRTNNPPNTRRPLFPGRKSGYIDHIKTQNRVNSAKIKFAANPSTTTRPTRQRAKTAPLDSPRGSELYYSSRPGSISRQQSRDTSGSLKQESTPGEISSKIDLTAELIGLDDDRSSSGASGFSHKEIQPRKFVVRETGEGTIYIDNGKVVFFRKSRQNRTDLMKVNGAASTEKGGFLASIRREYLNKPRYLVNTAKTHGRKSSSQDRLIQRERVNYNKKVGHILDYYSSDDEDQISMDDLSRYTKSPRSWRNTSDTRDLSPRVRKIYLDENPRHDRRHASPHHDVMDDPSSYLTLTSQSKLHDRKFYLRTPGIQMLVPGAQGITAANYDKNCECGMCRIEMQISLLAQLGIEFPAPEQLANEHFLKHQAVKQAEQDTQTDNKTSQTEIQNHKEVKTNKPTETEISTRPEQVLKITLPEMTSERETTDLSTRGSAGETFRSVPGD
ncbi:uncharacterized protein LOC110463006 isoform X2 [Mizuhopecten yessoensis]|uniref:Uncharacterized protein n=1 Tax=Mizuhopecten yessoensis TaxID=6573 RepID=A0A210PX05_MIZYE|nr:uncharacterized protein LOC110463006 isoform X2 [Mizuhopecten yessoensis]OWF41038.1 hypothetical protein KP79_PYT17090 [Mizuhopecten yessoensis]